MHVELQVYDLYVFMRKMLEKNRWNPGLGMADVKDISSGDAAELRSGALSLWDDGIS